MKPTPQRSPTVRTIVLLALLLVAAASAQQVTTANDPEASGTRAGYSTIERQMQVVMAALAQTRRELQQSEERMEQLQAQLKQLQAENPSSGASDTSGGPSLAEAVQGLREESSILQSQVKQQDQEKVETSSKFPLRVNGMILFNSFANDGVVDNQGLPSVALARPSDIAHNGFGALMTQSIVGLNAFGPTVMGARSNADVHIDFFGLPYTYAAAGRGVAYLRTAHVGLDWANTSVSAGIDTPFISPLNPTSLATVAQPSMAWSGNLWNWMPQVALEHRLLQSGTSHVGIQAGLLDPAYRALPGEQGGYTSQASARPGYESRLSYNWTQGLDQFGIGAGAYYSRTEYQYHYGVNSWAVAGDWNLPLRRWAQLSGEVYRGNAIGQLGGGAFKDVIPIPDSEAVRGLDSAGGWSQLKFPFTRRFEGNFAVGQDTGFGNQIRAAFYPVIIPPDTAAPYVYLARNRTVMGNLIYRPRTYLLFSLEYRNLQSWPVVGPRNQAQIWTLSAGYLF